MAVAAALVVAAAIEAVAVHRGEPGPTAMSLSGAPVLGVLAVRRTRPVLCLCVLTVFAVLGMIVQLIWWPGSDDSGGVWIFAMLLACYSLGRRARGRVLALGGLLPLTVVLCADLPTSDGWALVNGVLFVSVFVGVLPTLVGRLVRLRHDRLALLTEQRARIVAEEQARREAAVLAERLRTTERLRPALLDGLRSLASQAEAGAEPATLETAARSLLGRTREEVVALTAPVVVAPQAVVPVPDHVLTLRRSAHRWAALGAGVVAVALAMETTYAAPGSTSAGPTLLAVLGVGLPFAFLPWRPVIAVSLVWAAASAYSHLVMALPGTISEPTLALSTSFGVAVLATGRWRAVGLLVCVLGQVAGVSQQDAIGTVLFMLLAWLGGLVVQEATRLLEQERANNAVLADQQSVLAHRAVVEERFRLAREVHDQLGHSLTVAALHAGAARRLAGDDRARRAELLRTIAAVAREGVEAIDAAEPADGSTSTAAVLQRIRAAGLEVRADLGSLEVLDPGCRATAHRVVQEALTNVLRHAPGASAEVRVTEQERTLVVQVSNSAPTGAGEGPGTERGLVGLRERVEAVGGTIRWGARADGGFDLVAELPTAAAGALR